MSTKYFSFTLNIFRVIDYRVVEICFQFVPRLDSVAIEIIVSVVSSVPHRPLRTISPRIVQIQNTAIFFSYVFPVIYLERIPSPRNEGIRNYFAT